MNPQDAFNMLVNAARQLKLTAAEHDTITQAALELKPIIEEYITNEQEVKKLEPVKK